MIIYPFPNPDGSLTNLKQRNNNIFLVYMDITTYQGLISVMV